MALIIGAGPAGLFAGENIGNCTILEEHSEVGLPEQCGGLISRSGIEELEVFDKNYVLNEIRHSDFHSPNSHFRISKEKTVAYSVCRVAFDQYLAKRAENKGCTIKTNSCVTKIEQKNGIWKAHTQGKTYEDEHLILACGNNASLVSQAGLTPYQPEKLLKCIQANCLMDTSSDTVSLHFSNNLAKGFFAWTIPAGKYVRVGVGSMDNAQNDFENFTKKIGAIPETKFADIIPIKGPLAKTEGKQVYLVGDTAGQVKPTTGGGIVTGMKAAKILADCIKNETSYEKAWRAELQKDFELGLMINKIVSRLSDSQFDNLFELLKKEDAVSILQEYGHMDQPSTLLKSAKVRKLIFQNAALFFQTREGQP
ncbi:geranylgeranyl reductase family protein [Candidatus Undinarchaeota archaeon]